LEDKQLQNEMVKNLLSVSRKTWSCIFGKFQPGHPCQNHVNFLPIGNAEFSSRSLSDVTQSVILARKILKIFL
jgi:hypothetical protein